jgi:hypothetical protein
MELLGKLSQHMAAAPHDRPRANHLHFERLVIGRRRHPDGRIGKKYRVAPPQLQASRDSAGQDKARRITDSGDLECSHNAAQSYDARNTNSARSQSYTSPADSALIHVQLHFSPVDRLSRPATTPR